MANRSYIYLKNGDEARILTEGVYTILFFGNYFGMKKICECLVFYGKNLTSYFLLKNSLKNRTFLEKNAPQALQLYDDFVRYILANVKDGDMLGFDILEVASMDGLSIASRKLLKNIRAIQGNQPQELDFSLTGTNLIGLAMGFPDYYASKLLPEDNILDSVAYQDELKKMQRPKDKQVQVQEAEQVQVQEDKLVQRQEAKPKQEQVQEDDQVLDETGVEAKENKRGNGVIYLFLLALVIRLIFYMMAKR